MANEHWYLLKVRPGFETVVAQKLRKLTLEVLVPDQESINPHEPLRESRSHGYLYCRFALENQRSVTRIPGVIAILGAPEPMAFDKGMVSVQETTNF